MNPCPAIPGLSCVQAACLALSGARRQVLKETLTTSPHELVHLFKAVRAAVVGIGNILRRSVQKQSKPGAARSAHAFEGREIVPVHGDDGVEAAEIICPHLPCPLGGNIDLMPRGYLDRAWVRRIADVPGTGSRAIDYETVCQPCLLHDIPENAFRKWRPADVAKANEEDGVGQAGYP